MGWLSHAVSCLGLQHERTIPCFRYTNEKAYTEGERKALASRIGSGFGVAKAACQMGVNCQIAIRWLPALSLSRIVGTLWLAKANDLHSWSFCYSYSTTV